MITLTKVRYAAAARTHRLFPPGPIPGPQDLAGVLIEADVGLAPPCELVEIVEEWIDAGHAHELIRRSGALQEGSPG